MILEMDASTLEWSLATKALHRARQHYENNRSSDTEKKLRRAQADHDAACERRARARTRIDWSS